MAFVTASEATALFYIFAPVLFDVFAVGGPVAFLATVVTLIVRSGFFFLLRGLAEDGGNFLLLSVPKFFGERGLYNELLGLILETAIVHLPQRQASVLVVIEVDERKAVLHGDPNDFAVLGEGVLELLFGSRLGVAADVELWSPF